MAYRILPEAKGRRRAIDEEMRELVEKSRAALKGETLAPPRQALSLDHAGVPKTCIPVDEASDLNGVGAQTQGETP